MKKFFSFVFLILLTYLFSYCQTNQSAPTDTTKTTYEQAENKETEYTKAETKTQTTKENDQTMDKRLKLVNEAQKYLGVPYKYGGTSSTGFDCSGFVYRCALDALSIELPHSASKIAACSKRLPNDAKPQIGDFLFFNTTGTGIAHIGIYIGEGKFVHAASQGPRIGVIISSLSENYWKRCFLFYGTIF
ncbi:MAG: C40 family peptidase [Treponemataceae bacterium]